jgi:hypothetical protein
MSEQENEPRAKLGKFLSHLFHHTALSTTIAAVSLAAPLVNRFLGENSSIQLEILIIAVATYFALNIFTDRLVHKVLDVELSVFSVTFRLMRLTLEQRKAVAKEMALSFTYLENLKMRHSNIKLALLACSVALVVVNFRLPALDLLDLAAASIAVLGLLVLKEAVVECRIRNGLFGTTRSEAWDLIDFIVKNSEDIDFTDDGGNIRKALLPEESKQGELKPQFAHGGVAA